MPANCNMRIKLTFFSTQSDCLSFCDFYKLLGGVYSSPHLLTVLWSFRGLSVCYIARYVYFTNICLGESVNENKSMCLAKITCSTTNKMGGSGLMVSSLDFGLNGLGLKPQPGSLCCVLGKTLYSQI